MVKQGKRRAAVRGFIGLGVGLAAVLATAGFATGAVRPATALPKVDVVGRGAVDCKDVTGEIGFSPRIIVGGNQPVMVSIWFQGTDCAGPAKPLPKRVIGSMSFLAKVNACPLASPAGAVVGSGLLNLAHNYPPVPAPIMIDPSVAPVVNVTPGAIWTLSGPVTWGSYVNASSTIFTAKLKPVVVGPENCRVGITSMRISSGVLINV
jgi:hypothetical protein